MIGNWALQVKLIKVLDHFFGHISIGHAPRKYELIHLTRSPKKI